MQVRCRNKRLTEYHHTRRERPAYRDPRKELLRVTTAAHLFFNSFVLACGMGLWRVFLEPSFKRGPLTMQQGPVGERMIQEAGPPQLPFRRIRFEHGTVSSQRAWRHPTCETGPGEAMWLPVASLYLRPSPPDRPYQLAQRRENALIFRQISRKFSRLAGLWLCMPLTQSLAIVGSATRDSLPRFSTELSMSPVRARTLCCAVRVRSCVCCEGRVAASALVLGVVSNRPLGFAKWPSVVEGLTI
jgi:hypothetical protein